MKYFTSLFVLVSILGTFTACKSAPKAAPAVAAPAPPALPATIEEAVASPSRSAENRARDMYRHPVETLSFFGLKPDMTVIEISPGGGWYLEILAPLLAGHGHYIAALPETTGSENMTKMNNKVREWIKAHPAIESSSQTALLAPPADLVSPGSADMVLTFRNVHNWMNAGNADKAFKTFFNALKPGGVLGVVEHRLDPKAKQDPKAKSGYVSEKTVIRLATKAGFKLDAKSEINANAKDTKDYADGVWTLPPTLRLGEKDRAKYLAIGESDRMTLRFVKPAKK